MLSRLVSIATTGNTGQNGQGIRRSAPEVHDAQPPLSAWATTGNTGKTAKGYAEVPPKSTMLSRPCQHGQRLATLGRVDEAGLAYENNIASRHTQESHRRDLCCVLAPSTGAAIFFLDHVALNTLHV